MRFRSILYVEVSPPGTAGPHQQIEQRMRRRGLARKDLLDLDEQSPEAPLPPPIPQPGRTNHTTVRAHHPRTRVITPITHPRLPIRQSAAATLAAGCPRVTADIEVHIDRWRGDHDMTKRGLPIRISRDSYRTAREGNQTEELRPNAIGADTPAQWMADEATLSQGLDQKIAVRRRMWVRRRQHHPAIMVRAGRTGRTIDPGELIAVARMHAVESLNRAQSEKRRFVAL